MYIPPHFAETLPQELERIIRENPLGMLVTHQGEGFDANHIPFEFDPGAGGHGMLTAHVARANPVWQRAVSEPVMVAFRGVAGYISPSWYPSKHEAHRQVPTWNYEVVHVHGVLAVQDNERFARGLVARLTRRHEASEPTPWKMGDSAPEFIDAMLRNIVGIEIAITSMEAKVKLSQNKEVRDRVGASDALEKKGLSRLAGRMRPAE